MIPTEEREDMVPLCPQCKAELRTVYYRRLSSLFGKRYIYFCPSCRVTLGVSPRKGFWMG